MDLSTPLDTQKAAIRDNGSPEGIMDVNIQSGPMVSVPFREGHFSVSGASWSSGNLIGGGDNDDGSTVFLQFAMATTLPVVTPNYIRHLFYGTRYGIRFNPLFTSGGGGKYDFCVIIDRVAYRVRKNVYYDDTLEEWNILGNGAHNVLVARDLADGPHYAEINITPQAGVNGQIIWGFSADKKYYRQYPPRGFLNAPIVLTTNLVAAHIGANQQYRGLGLRGIMYCNTDASAHLVEVEFNDAIVWRKMIDGGDTQVFDPLTVVGVSGLATYKHKADANSVIQSTVIAGN